MEWFRRMARRMLGRDIEYERVMNVK